MVGCRSLTDTEIQAIKGVLSTRNQCLFILGCKTGFRISELLSLTVGDVYRNGQVLDRVRVAKRNVKGKTRSHELPIHPEAKQAIQAWVVTMPVTDPAAPLFPSRIGTKAITRYMAHKLLKEAYAKAGVTGGTLATHCLRKSFAKRIYEKLDYDLFATRDALNHRSIEDTVKYLQPDKARIDAAILAA
jgi:integrase